MDTELLPLAALVGSQLVLGLVATYCVSRVTGAGWVLGSRGVDADLGGTLAGRMARARVNGFEAIVYFAPIVFLLEAGDGSTVTTVTAA